MKLRTMMGLVGATAASVVGVAGIAATPAGAGGNGAQPVPLSVVNELAGDIVTLIPPGTFPNITVTGDCPSYLFSTSDVTNGLGFFFTDGSAHMNRGINPANGLPNNINVEGDAYLVENGTQTLYWGTTHTWFGQNFNPKTGRAWQNSTTSFSGTAPDGSTITFSTNPGGSELVSSDPNVPPTPLNGWGQETVTCTPPTNG